MFSSWRVPAWLEGSGWLFAGLVLLTVIPSVCVLWFTNEAMRTESTAARQRVLDAYRGQLRLVRSRLDGVWRAQAARLNLSGDVARSFEHLVTNGVAEGVVFIRGDGTMIYPSPASHGPVMRSLEGSIASLGSLTGQPQSKVVETIADRLNDYTSTLSAADRLALMDRLRVVAPNVWLPTQAALHVSFDLLAAEAPTPVPDVVRKTAMPDIWALTSADRQVIGLYRTGRIEAMMHDFLHEVSPAGIVFVAYPPDERADVEAVAAGPWLPGWQLSFIPLESTRVDDLARRRRALYLSVAIMGVGLIVVVGAAAGGGLRRQLHLARLKTDLVAAASHELRTPVTAIRVLVDGLLADRTLDQAKTREYLQLLGAESERLSRQIDSFLTFSRLDRRRYRFALGPVTPSALVDATLAAMRERMPADAAVTVELEASLPAVNADGEMMTTALTNILDNAIKYTSSDKRITLRVYRDGDWVAFACGDNGIGIATRERRRIFRRFYQVDQRLTRETGGVGLGLSIVALIVRGHRGRLAVTSAIGSGSTFTVRLPIATEQAA